MLDSAGMLLKLWVTSGNFMASCVYTAAFADLWGISLFSEVWGVSEV
jgi:hypothetical protein